MQKQERIPRQVLQRDPHDVSGAGEPRVRVSDTSFGLKPGRPQPLVREHESLAAVVVLSVIDSYRAPIPNRGAVPRHAIGNAGQQLGQVQCGIGLVPDPEEEHLAVEIVNPSDGASGYMGRERQRIGEDRRGVGPRSGKGLAMIAPPYTRQSPEQVGHDAQVARSRSGRRIEGLVVIARPGRHHQRAVRALGGAEGLDQPEWSSLDRSDGPEGSVHQQDTTCLDADRAEMVDDVDPAELRLPGSGVQLATPSRWCEGLRFTKMYVAP